MVNYPYYEHKLLNNFEELLKLNIEENKNKNEIAFGYFNKDKELVEISYSKFYEDVHSLAKYISKRYKNSNIAIVSPNSYNWLVVFFAITISGNNVVIIDKELNIDTILKYLKNTDVKLIFTNNTDKYGKYEVQDIDAIFNLKESSEGIINDKGEVIFFTSGTTGFGKAVVLTQKNIMTDIYAASSLFKPNGSVYAVLPFHHSFGLVTGIFKPFYYGYPVIINQSLKNIMSELKEAKPNTLFLVPAFVETFYRQIWKNARRSKKENKLKVAITISNALLKIGIDKRKVLFKSILNEFGGNLEYIICGGAYLDKKYVKWFRSIGIEILNGYGITECSPVISVNRNNYYKDGSIGVPVKDVEVKIIDNEICIKGDIVMKGYYKNPKETKKVIIDNYFHTGDLGYIDEDGFIFITGREKNIIILSNGENISPEEIEEEIAKDKAVREVVVYEKENHLVCSIFPEDDYLSNNEYFDALIAKYNKNVPVNHQLAYFYLRDKEFIKNNNRKIIRNKVEE